MKMKTLKVTYPYLAPKAEGPQDPNAWVYRVDQVTNSLDFSPGQYLAKSVVDDTSKYDDWTVIVNPSINAGTVGF